MKNGHPLKLFAAIKLWQKIGAKLHLNHSHDGPVNFIIYVLLFYSISELTLFIEMMQYTVLNMYRKLLIINIECTFRL